LKNGFWKKDRFRKRHRIGNSWAIGNKRQPVLIRYTDKGLEKSMLLDFRANTGYAYFHIYERFRKAKSLASSAILVPPQMKIRHQCICPGN
jgi:hypothetical protein